MKPKKLALDRVNELFAQAEKEPSLADRYVELARKVAMKAQLSMPSNLRRKYCHKCYSYLFPDRTGKYRIVNKVQEVICLKCGNVDRYPLK